MNNVILPSVNILRRDWAVGHNRFYTYSCSVLFYFRKCSGQKYCIVREQELNNRNEGMIVYRWVID